MWVVVDSKTKQSGSGDVRGAAEERVPLRWVGAAASQAAAAVGGAVGRCAAAALNAKQQCLDGGAWRHEQEGGWRLWGCGHEVCAPLLERLPSLYVPQLRWGGFAWQLPDICFCRCVSAVCCTHPSAPTQVNGNPRRLDCITVCLVFSFCLRAPCTTVDCMFRHNMLSKRRLGLRAVCFI